MLMVLSPKINVFVSEVDLFDYSRGEPGPEYPTILRVLNVSSFFNQAYFSTQPTLQVSNEFVLRILINHAKIERLLLAPTRSAADNVLSSIGEGGQCLTADLWRVQRWRFVSTPFDVSSPFNSPPLSDGGGQSQPMQSLKPNDPRNLLFTNQNAETQLRLVFTRILRSCSMFISPPFLYPSRRHWQEQAESAEAKLQTLKSQLNELRERFKQAQREIETQNVRTSLT
jgi:hypothetical protein